MDECSNNTECGSCRYCNEGFCEDQNNNQDLKNECNQTLIGCNINHNEYEKLMGLCDGAGSCTNNTFGIAVSAGNVCINSTSYDVAPNPLINCDVWSDCIAGNNSANQYYVGYSYGTLNCDDNNWQSAGTTINYTKTIWETEHTNICTLEPLSDYNSMTGAVIDNGTKIIVGFGAIAVLFGIVIAGIGIYYGWNKYIIKK
jgi:hypothetical protein